MTLKQYANVQQFAPYCQTGKVTCDFVATQIGLSTRQVRRLMKRLIPPIKRTAWNRYPDEIRQYIKEQKQENLHYNCQWLAEVASDHFGLSISQATVWRILKEANLLALKPVKRIVRNRFEAEKSGDLVQLDTTWGYWLKGKKLCLTVLLDDYSRYLLKGQFTWHDTAIHNMKMIRQVIEGYGVFRLLYTDNASFFRPIRHNRSCYQNHRKKEYESEITRACREAEIIHITHKPYEPQGKGKLERLFRFIQERFISQIDDTATLDEINWEFLSWVDWYNTSHRVRTTGQTPEKRFDPKGFKPLSGQHNLDDVFCFKDTRKVDKCNQFSYQGKVYTIPKEKCMVAYTVNLHILPEKSIRVWHNDEFVCELPVQHKVE